MKRNLFTLLVLIAWISQSLGSELPRVSECEEPVYSLDESSADPELKLELGVMAFTECLFHVIDSHEQSPSGDQGQIRIARRAYERIDLDIQELFPRIDVINAAMANGLWTESRNAAAVVVHTKAGYVFVMLKISDNYLVVNVSPIVPALFAKLGSADRAEYQKYTVEPVRWIRETGPTFVAELRLRAWRDDQRYSVTAPVVVNQDGTVSWQ